MKNNRFDAAHAVSFDLANGHVEVARLPRALVPVSALESLCQRAGGDAARDFGRLVGAEIGRRLADNLSETADAALVVEHLGGEFALLGFGSLGLEIWGSALVFTLASSPLSPAADPWVAGVFEGALQRGLGRSVHAVELARVEGTARVLMAGERGAALAREAVASGKSFVEVVGQLNAAGGVA